MLMRTLLGRRSARRQYGKVWDVLGFWPRAYHPLAAPCYAERAVPEVRDRIAHHLSEGRAVVVTAHSKGSVIAYAALCQMTVPGAFGVKPDDLKRVALVTFGSPLHTLHASNFARFFRPDQFDEVSAALADDPLGWEGPPIAWSNLYRPTDYIGRRVFTRDASQTEDDRDRWLFEAASVRTGLPEPLFPMQSHSEYWKEHALREWTVQVVGHLNEPPG
jgi:hypothetical protein